VVGSRIYLDFINLSTMSGAFWGDGGFARGPGVGWAGGYGGWRRLSAGCGLQGAGRLHRRTTNIPDTNTPNHNLRTPSTPCCTQNPKPCCTQNPQPCRTQIPKPCCTQNPNRKHPPQPKQARCSTPGLRR